MKRCLPYFIFITATIILFLPGILHPEIILQRKNDLEGFFWPIFYFVKTHLISDRSAPLWNNLFLSGAPLLSDPQTPIFYPPNFIFLFTSLDRAFLISFFLHFLIGGIGMYWCSKRGFRFSKITSIFLACLYIFAPKFTGYIEAGHIGLINSLAWIPFALWSALELRHEARIKFGILLGVSLALTYYSHLPTFMIVSLTFGLLALTRKSIPYLFMAIGITFGLTAISLFPQLTLQSYSTRYLLLQNIDTYPKWTSILEPLKNTLIPFVNGIGDLQKIDSEKWIALGFIPTLLALWGFIKIGKKQKFVLLAAVALIFLIVLNNASPIYPLLVRQNWFLLLRVSTRFWILIVLTVIYLSGLAVEKIKLKYLIYPLMLTALLESFVLGQLYLSKPIPKNDDLISVKISQYLSSDKSRFRVFCLTRCIYQNDAAIYNLELLDGYNTIQQKNFSEEAWQLTGTYWNYYTLSIPPLGTFTEKLKPDVKELGHYNVKYLIAPYPLTDQNLILKNRIENYYIYENKLVFPRAYYKLANNIVSEAPIVTYQPNYIKVDTASQKSTQLILAEVYSPGWKAYANGNQVTAIQETPEALRAIDIPSNTKYIELRYAPESYLVGKYLTLGTILSLAGYFVYEKHSKKQKS